MAEYRAKKCPICGIESKLLWRHFWSKHKDSGLSDEEFLARYLGLDEPNKCPNCNRVTAVRYSNYEFREFCSHSCRAHVYGLKNQAKSLSDWAKNNPELALEVRRKNGYKIAKTVFQRPEIIKRAAEGQRRWRERNPELRSKISSKTIKDNPHIIEALQEGSKRWAKDNPELKREITLRNGYGRVSDTEIKIFNRIKRLLSNEVVLSNPIINEFKPDILLDNRKLIIEVDGRWCHSDYDRDENRDKVLFNAGYKVRRLDTEYLRYSISDEELLYLIALETMIDIPYWERIPRDEIEHWKWDIYQTGPMKLLTYEH